MKRDIVFWFPTVEPYYIDRFNALAARNTVNFECWYTRGAGAGRMWDVSSADMTYPHRFVPSVGIGNTGTGLPAREWVDANPEILVTQVGLAATAAAVLQRLRPHGRLLFYVEKTFEPVFQRTRAKELIKHVLFRCANGVVTPGADADAAFRQYTHPGTPFYRLTPAIDHPHYRSAIPLRATTCTADRRARLGLRGTVFMYVGRISYLKGVDTLIRAFAELERAGLDASLLLVGDSVDRAELEAMVHTVGLQRVVFHDFVQRDRLPGMYALGDAFVFPTRGDSYGLVVDEAMAAGLPVISTSAAGEITDRVQPGRTGTLVPRDDVEALRLAMREFYGHRADLAAMGDDASRTVAARTPEVWAEQVDGIVRAILEHQPSTSRRMLAGRTP